MLVQLSRSFDRSGARGFATFIGPLILDGIFHGAFPRLFAPNTLAMLQASESSCSLRPPSPSSLRDRSSSSSCARVRTRVLAPFLVLRRVGAERI